MILDGVFKVLGNLSGWFSPEQRTKAKREKRELLKKEIRKIKKQPWTLELAKKMERLENELEKINASLGS